MTSPTWPGGPTPNAPMPPGFGTPSASTHPMPPGARVRRTNWVDAMLFAVASATVSGVLWWALVAFTKHQFVYGALAVGALVGVATALGARRSNVATAVLAGACTLVALVVAQYFIERTLAIDAGASDVPLWDGLGFARDVVESALEEDGVIGLFWGLAVVAAAFTNARA